MKHNVFPDISEQFEGEDCRHDDCGEPGNGTIHLYRDPLYHCCVIHCCNVQPGQPGRISSHLQLGLILIVSSQDCKWTEQNSNLTIFHHLQFAVVICGIAVRKALILAHVMYDCLLLATEMIKSVCVIPMYSVVKVI